MESLGGQVEDRHGVRKCIRGHDACSENAMRRGKGPWWACCQVAPLARRLLMLYEDWREVKKLLAKAKQLCDSGGDWERKNKLKVRWGCRRGGWRQGGGLHEFAQLLLLLGSKAALLSAARAEG